MANEQPQKPVDRLEHIQPKIDPSVAVLVEALGKLQSGGLTKDDLSEVMEKNSEGIRRALKPENATHPDISAFNPRGERDHPRPRLKRKTFWAGIELDADDLDVDEIELLNKFDHTKEARNGQWRAEMRRTSSKGVDELHILFPCATVDDRMDLPGMKVMLQELHGGAKAVDAVSLQQRIEQLEAQLSKRA